MEKIYNSPWFTKLVAFAFALLLFTYVNYENTSKLRTTNPLNGVSTTSSKVITNLPIVVDIDQDKYFVSGFPETASIEITGPTNIVAQTTANKGFDLVAQNLDELGVGTHTIRLIPEGLSSDLKYTVTPPEVTITIEEKRVETFKVGVDFDSSSLAKGYAAETPTLNYDTVEVSGAASTIDKVNTVQAVIPTTDEVKSDIKQTVPVSARDINGNQLDVMINPKEVTVNIRVKPESKTVPVVLSESGKPESGYTYELGIENEKDINVTVTGTQETLDNLSSFPLEVDVSGITETTTKEVDLPLLDGISTVTPEKITVRITVTKDKKPATEDKKTEDSSKNSSSTSTSDEKKNESTSSSTENTASSEEPSSKTSSSSAVEQSQPNSSDESKSSDVDSSR